jgi:hypothetical protein
LAGHPAGGSAALRTGSPPAAGTIGEDAIERLVMQWMRKPKSAADYAQLPRPALLKQARVLCGLREDLGTFSQARTPITARAFDYLDVLLRMTEAEDPPSAKRVAARRPTADSRAAMKDAEAALRSVLNRAEACGRTLRLYELSLPPWNEAGLVVQLLHVVQAGRRRVEKWDDPVFAQGLFTALEKAALELESAWKLEPTAPPRTEAVARAMALHRLLYDAITYMSAYGRAVFSPDDDRVEPYTLRVLFPRRGKPRILPPLKMLNPG